MTVPSLSVVPETLVSGTAPHAEPAIPSWYARSADLTQQAVARASRADYPAWLSHVKAASACTRPVRLAGTIATIEAATGRLLTERSTADMPDGVIYKPCGNRRELACPSCSKLYQRDAYQIVRAGLAGGKGVPEQVAEHPAVFPTFTAPSFGEVHTRVVRRHTCARRKDCDCRPEPCHARRDFTVCPHGARLVCFARHDSGDARLGIPLCPDCYDYDAHAVWNIMSGELWRRTTIAISRYLHQLARRRGVPDVWVTAVDAAGRVSMVRRSPVRVEYDKASEMQRRAAVHFHCIVRLDGRDPDRPDTVVPPPAGLDAQDLKAAVDHAAATVAFTTDPHPTRPDGWRISWGKQVLTKVVTTNGHGDGEISTGKVASYLAKYATKSTETTGHTSARLTADTIDLYANPQGSHTERLVATCWRLGRARWACPNCRQHSTRTPCPICAARGRHHSDDVPDRSPYLRLQRWAHMLGFGGHFLTKSRRYSVTFSQLRAARVVFRRSPSTGPEQVVTDSDPAALVVNFLQFVGSGWRTPADAMLANTSAAMAREHQEAARRYVTTPAA